MDRTRQLSFSLAMAVAKIGPQDIRGAVHKHLSAYVVPRGVASVSSIEAPTDGSRRSLARSRSRSSPRDRRRSRRRRIGAGSAGARHLASRSGRRVMGRRAHRSVPRARSAGCSCGRSRSIGIRECRRVPRRHHAHRVRSLAPRQEPYVRELAQASHRVGASARPVVIGLVHGLAGSAGIALLTATTVSPRVSRPRISSSSGLERSLVWWRSPSSCPGPSAGPCGARAP